MAQRLEQELAGLHHRTMEQAAAIGRMVERTVELLHQPDVVRAGAIAIEDVPIDAEEVRIEETAVRLLALHAPAAIDLRRIASLIKINQDLEQSADCATSIAARLAELAARRQDYHPTPDLRTLARAAADAFQLAIRAFDQSDADAAEQVKREDDILDALHLQVSGEMTQAIEHGADPTECLANILIAKDFERLGDHAENIAREVLYVRTGAIIRHEKGTDQDRGQ